MKPYYVQNPNSEYVSLVWAESAALAVASIMADQDICVEEEQTLNVWEGIKEDGTGLTGLIEVTYCEKNEEWVEAK